MTAPAPAPREYAVGARSTSTFGRVLCSARTHHFIVDGPIPNGCPGEEVTPPEAFLAGVAACGVELVQVIARERSVPIGDISVRVQAIVDRSRPVRPDVTLFNSVRVRFTLAGVSKDRAGALIEEFQKR
ncbi:MAG TPA: OsmC family protein [Gemmatimonadaceae bacterium]|nr:OsmC family protein [Gemmatimonadaceae bacterium]